MSKIDGQATWTARLSSEPGLAETHAVLAEMLARGVDPRAKVRFTVEEGQRGDVEAVVLIVRQAL